MHPMGKCNAMQGCFFVVLYACSGAIDYSTMECSVCVAHVVMTWSPSSNDGRTGITKQLKQFCDNII